MVYEFPVLLGHIDDIPERLTAGDMRDSGGDLGAAWGCGFLTLRDKTCQRCDPLGQSRTHLRE